MADAEAVANGEDRSTELITIEQAPAPATILPTSVPWGKYLGIATGTIVLVGAIISVPQWVVKKMKESSDEIRVEITKGLETNEKALQLHAKHPHEDAVPRELYDLHVRQADDRHKESKAERKEILQKLDHIGRRTHGEARWERVQERE